jgi:hypothetical protein
MHFAGLQQQQQQHQVALLAWEKRRSCYSTTCKASALAA